ncbi:MAG: hypothetical protein IK093_06945 [Ruminiclostridium sp.]|nr:hypothetical protein [Ruminiclostridium sp.]
MKRDNILLIGVKGLGLAVFGNVLGGIMTVSTAPLLSEWYIPYIELLFTVFIYASLAFTAGLRDGQKEAKMLRAKRVESVPKYRWIGLGIAIAAVMFIPCGALLACALGAFPMTGELLLGSYFVFGALAPAFFIIEDVQAMPAAFPIVLAAVYLIVTPAAAHLGYKFGIDDKSMKDFMYEK